jgi:hypothetical protein
VTLIPARAEEVTTTAKTDDRLFAPFPIEMDEHPKICILSDAAFRALFEATFYSRRLLSDGFLDERVVLKRWGREVADELSSNDPERPSWVRVEGIKPGWRIHDFEKHHTLRADVEATREKRREAGRLGGLAKASKTVANGKQGSSKVYPETESETETELTTPKGVVGRKKPETRLPADWKPKPSHVKYATDNGIDGRHEEAQFRAHAAANDRRQRDWDGAFRYWLGNAAKWSKAAPSKRADADGRFAATLALADSLKEIES